MTTRHAFPTTQRTAWRIIAGVAAVQLVACGLGSLRADDWVNLERGRVALSSDWRTIWTTLNPFTLYRPLVDVWHGTMVALFGYEPGFMLAMLVGHLALQSWLLSRLVRQLGGSRETAALAALAVWAQSNTYTWTTLWVSNATGSLMTTFALLTMVALASAARLRSQGRSARMRMSLMLFAYVATMLCKEESVLLPGVVAALATMRWHEAKQEERRTWIGGIALSLALGAIYVGFRTVVLATPQMPGNRYTLHLGPHVFRNLGFFAVHLGALPITVAVLARFQFPFAFTPAARQMRGWAQARTGILAGLAWTVVACLLYLPISGRPAYGYLYAPAFGIAFAVAHALTFAANAQATTTRPRSPWSTLAVHALIATSLTAAALVSNQWHRFGAIHREALITLRREVPDPPPNAIFVFLDSGAPETPS
ncbi:MAG: hypothetical protein ABIU54_05840, partial [Candidatus Eisenbacteria bacterium]